MARQKARIELSADQQAAHRLVRETLGRERKGPSLRDLIASGEIDPAAVTTVGDYEDFRDLIDRLREERKRLKLSLKDASERMGARMDAPALSRLERGENDNPTINTVAQYARALGKRLNWGLVDAQDEPHRSEGGRDGAPVG